MRKSGKTTRTIDSAIQHLFEFGKIYIPTDNLFMEHEGFEKVFRGTGAKESDVFYDIDWRPNNSAQKHFITRLSIRLSNEHPNQVDRIINKHFSVYKAK